MANTTIQLRYSTETGNVPVSLANGEIAINTQDGKLFYADPTGTVQEFSTFAGPSGLDTEIQFNDSGSLGANSLLTFNKTLSSLNVGGVSLTNTYIQFGDGTRQYTANAGSGGGGSGVTIVVDSFAGTGACTTFTLSVTPTNENYTVVTINGVTQAKTTYSLSSSNIIFSEAPPDSAEIEVLSFATLGVSSLLAYDEEFSGTGACTTFTLTNTPTSENYTIVSIDGVIQHKSTYSLSSSDVIFSEAPLNGSVIDVNYFITTALADTTLITYAANHANAAFDAANNATDTYVRAHANAAFDHANAVFGLANTINSNYATQLFVNTAIADLVNTAPSTLDTLNELAAALNNDPNFATTTATLIGNSFNKANAAFDAANTNSSNITTIQGVDNTQNTNITTATNTGTAAFIHANAAFDAANNNVGGNSFGIIYASNNSVYANATSATDTIIFTGVNGTVVEGNATTKTITFAGTPGLQGLSVDYGLVSDALVYSLDYGTL